MAQTNTSIKNKVRNLILPKTNEFKQDPESDHPRRIIRVTSCRGGINCGCFRVCTFFNFSYLFSREFLIKVWQIALPVIFSIDFVLKKLGVPLYDTTVRQAAEDFVQVVWTVAPTSCVMMIACTFSNRTFHLVRQSKFDPLYSLFACVFYTNASYQVLTKVSSQGYLEYPTMITLYLSGFLTAGIYLTDLVLAIKYKAVNTQT